jgi:hypothetical protein
METQTHLTKRMIKNIEEMFLNETDYIKNMNLLKELQDLILEINDTKPHLKDKIKPHFDFLNDLVCSLIPDNNEDIKDPFNIPILYLKSEDFEKLEKHTFKLK